MPDQIQSDGKPVVDRAETLDGIVTGLHATETDLDLERGGPYYRLMQRIGWIQGEDMMIRPRIIMFIALTWLPMFAFAWLEGRAIGPTPRESFLLDFTTYARYFIAAPILIAAEAVVGRRLRKAALHIVECDFIRPQDYAAFDRAVARVIKWRDAFWPEVVILVIAVAGASTLTIETMHQGGVKTWHSILGQGLPLLRISLTGIWHHLIAIPLLQFLMYRWLWRLLIWARFLFDVSRLNLALSPTHADEAGGLGFLGNAHLSLGMLAFGLGAVLSADAAFRIIFEGAAIVTFKIPFLILIIVCQALFLGPLLLFAPLLMRTRREGLQQYGALELRYNRAFHEKWIEGKVEAGEPLLGSSDIQSLADLGNSFGFIHAMKAFPFSPKVMIQLAVMTVLPGLPLILLVVPIEKVLDTLAGAVF